MFESDQAVYRFLTENGYDVGCEYRTAVSAIRDNECVYQDNTEWQISYDHRYEQYTINIMWGIGESSWRALDLYGQYNTNFQAVKYQNGVLTVIDSGNKIIVNITGHSGEI